MFLNLLVELMIFESTREAYNILNLPVAVELTIFGLPTELTLYLAAQLSELTIF